jgi:hypothetical protein
MWAHQRNWYMYAFIFAIAFWLNLFLVEGLAESKYELKCMCVYVCVCVCMCVRSRFLIHYFSCLLSFRLMCNTCKKSRISQPGSYIKQKETKGNTFWLILNIRHNSKIQMHRYNSLIL